jgi:hypothetical protein
MVNVLPHACKMYLQFAMWFSLSPIFFIDKFIVEKLIFFSFGDYDIFHFSASLSLFKLGFSIKHFILLA